MANYTWATATSGDWNTGTLWSGGTVPNPVPNASDANATIDVANATTLYTVTIAPAESITLASLTLNAQGDGTNDPTGYKGAVLEMDGTLTFTGSGTIGGSLQSQLLSNGGTFVNVGNLAPFTVGSGTVLFKGSNPFYVQDELQSQGTVIVDTASIGELIQNTLTDGIYAAVGDASVIDLGGSGGMLKPSITKIQGPPDQTAQFGFQGWTELQMNGPAAAINEWNGTEYVGIETTLNDVGGGGLLEALSGRGYTTANVMTLESRSFMWVQGGATSINGGLVLNAGTNSAIGGVFQGFGTITNAVTNNGTMVALGGTLDIAGALTGTGVVQFDKDYENFIQFGPTQGAIVTNPTGATLQVGSVSAGQTIVMNGDDTLILNTPSAFAGTITARVGDRIVLGGLTATSATVNGNNLLVFNGTQTVASLALAGTYTGDHVSVTGSTLTIAAAANQVVLHGPATQYVIANNNGSLYIQDTVAGRDGTAPTPPGVNEMMFTDGIGVFDPTGTAEDVARLYGAVLDRAPDLAGLEAWTAAVDDSNVPLSQVATDFTTSPEFISRYGSLSDSAFINQLYENVLHRPADVNGAQAWNNLLASGASRGTVVLGFAESQEYKADTLPTAGDNDNAEASRLYQAALNRVPDAPGLAAWSSALANGSSVTQVAQGFIDSSEFQADYGALDINDFVTTLYQNVLHRAPDAAGFQAWTTALQSGESKASVLVGFSDSLENRVQTASATHANWVFIPT